MRHPEQRKDEAFMGTISVDLIPKFTGLWKTARLGETAYGLRDEELAASEGFRPLFVKHAEIEARPNGAQIKKLLQSIRCW